MTVRARRVMATETATRQRMPSSKFTVYLNISLLTFT